MDKKLRVVHYINQFYAGFGGEDTAGMDMVTTDTAVGPGLLIDQYLAGAGEVVGTVICGDTCFAENLDAATAKALDAIRAFAPDIFIAGPGFNAGRYGLACGALTAAVRRELKIPAVTGLYAENPGAELYSSLCYIIGTENNARHMERAVREVTAFALKLAAKQSIGLPKDEGYLGTGPVPEINYHVSGPTRAVDMALDKFYGRPFATEVPMPQRDIVPPSVLDKPLRECKIAIVTDGGLVPRGNPDRMVPVNSVKFASYSVAGKDRLDAPDYEVKHQGYDNAYVLQDPNRLVPVDALRDLERQGVIGALADRFYTTAGVMTSLENGKRFGCDIAALLRKDGVDAVILTST